MTKKEIFALVEEFYAEEKKTVRVPHYYKRNGKILERSYPDWVETERYKELFSENSPLRTEKIFESEPSGEMVAFFDLEWWCCHPEDDYYISSIDYENEMGEDL